MADALFTINGDSSNQGFDATPGQVLTLRLKTLPVSGVRTVRFQVWDQTAFDPDLDPIRNPPRKAKGSPNLTLVGATSGPSVSPVAVDGTVQVTLPNSEDHAWLVRCVVNDGISTLPDGRDVFDRSLVHERMIVIRDIDSGARPIVATETTQYEDDGWAPEAGRPGPPGADGAPFTPATGNADGYLSRAVYANPASTRVGTSYFGVTVQAQTTFNTPADIPPGNWFRLALHAPGAGGTAGLQGHGAANHGGPGGGGGAWRSGIMSRRQFIALLPFAMALGLGADGGASSSGTTGTVVGARGLNAGSSTAGPWTVFGGGGGNQNNNAQEVPGGGGGGWRSGGAGSNSSTSDNAGGLPLAGLSASSNTLAEQTGASVYGGGAGGRGVNTSPARGGSSVYGGGGGGSPAGNSSAPGAGGISVYGGGGGGSGGFANGASTGDPGGAGGASGSNPGGTAGSGSNSVASPGGNGNDAPDPFNGSGSGGGGGGGANNATTSTTTGGKGGDGGFPGGGGGGGGSAVAANGTVATTGAGGRGADGAFVLEAYA